MGYTELQMADARKRESVNSNLAAEKVEIDGQRILIEWSDGHQGVYEAKHLRVSCGCAECVEEWSNRKLLDPATVPADIRAEDHLMVGKYAVQFLWSDSHYTGIYPFDVLRKLCQCDQCEESRE